MKQPSFVVLKISDLGGRGPFSDIEEGRCTLNFGNGWFRESGTSGGLPPLNAIVNIFVWLIDYSIFLAINIKLFVSCCCSNQTFKANVLLAPFR